MDKDADGMALELARILSERDEVSVPLIVTRLREKSHMFLTACSFVAYGLPVSIRKPNVSSRSVSNNNNNDSSKPSLG